MEKLEPHLLEHEVDGIREYDNPLPGWWRALFWGTIVFACGYVIWFRDGTAARYRADVADYDALKVKRQAAEAANVSEAMLAKNAADPAVVERGAKIFAAKCVACHTEDGHGLIGPNLTDNYQIHGSTRLDIYKTINGGAPGTPMLAWGEQLPGVDVVAVASFAITLRGKNIKGKEPQGAPVGNFE